MPGSLPHFALGVWKVSGAFSNCGVIAGLECVFHSGTSEITGRQEDTIALQQFNVRVIWLKIIDKTA